MGSDTVSQYVTADKPETTDTRITSLEINPIFSIPSLQAARPHQKTLQKPGKTPSMSQ